MYEYVMWMSSCHVFPGLVEEVRDALWSARAQWFNMGYVLGLPRQTLQVIEGHAVS